jgi:fluoride exporter
MFELLLVGVGGFIGAVLRFLVSGWLQKDAVFPYGTLGVNFLGSFALGFIMYASEYAGLFDDRARLFFAVGVLGAFTTMSTFSYESLRLLENEEFFLLGLNVLATVALTLFAVYLGKVLVLTIWRF